MERENLFNFDSAQVSYAKGKSESPQALITPLLTRRAEYLTKYIQLRNEIRRFDSIKTVLLLPPDTTQVLSTIAVDSTLDSLHKKADSTLQVLATTASDSTLNSVYGNPDSTLQLLAKTVSDSTLGTLHKKPDSVIVRPPAPPLMTLDSVNTRLAYDMTELAALFYTSMSLPDSAEHWPLTISKKAA